MLEYFLYVCAVVVRAGSFYYLALILSPAEFVLYNSYVYYSDLFMTVVNSGTVTAFAGRGAARRQLPVALVFEGSFVLALVALFDKLIGWPSQMLGLTEPLSITKILSWIFYPFAALLGIARADLAEAARLLGERVILTEVVSYQDLAQMVTSGQITDPRTVVILSYALCGFAHVASMAIFVGGTSALVPSRRDDLASLGLRALLVATLGTLMTGCVAGMFSDGSGVLIGK